MQILSKRMLGDVAAVGLDETSAVAISPDGTCEGRGRTIINRNQESIAILTPADVCGEQDTGRVESSQSDIVSAIIPGNDGLATNAQIRRNNGAAGSNDFEFSGIDPTTNEITVDYTDTNGNRRRGTVPVSSTDAPEELSRRYQALQDISVVSAGIKKGGDKGVTPAATPQLSEILSESMSYAALASNFTACVVSRFVAQFEALGEDIDPDVSSWALAGCTSALAEVSTWLDERTPEQIIAFETTVPELELDGCLDCYTDIASPKPEAFFTVGESISFNGIAPASNNGVFWEFGDGGNSDSRSPFHTYDQTGTYLAQFSVDYSDGSSGLKQVTVNVGALIGNGLAGKAGIWIGEVQEQGFTYSIRIEFNSNQTLISYPPLACGGFLTLVEEQPAQLLFRETITFGEGNCFDQGFVELTDQTANSLVYRYYFPDSANSVGELGAIGSLTRQ